MARELGQRADCKAFLAGSIFIVKYFPLASLAHLGLARALAQDGKSADSRLAYERFSGLWSGADPEIPVLAQAKAECAT